MPVVRKNLNIIKAIYDKPIVTSYLMVKAESISSRIRNKIRRPTLTTFIQHNFGTSSHSNQRRNINKRNPNHKGRSKAGSVCRYMTLYIENPNCAIKKLLELINEFSKIVGW